MPESTSFPLGQEMSRGGSHHNGSKAATIEITPAEHAQLRRLIIKTCDSPKFLADPRALVIPKKLALYLVSGAIDLTDAPLYYESRHPPDRQTTTLAVEIPFVGEFDCPERAPILQLRYKHGIRIVLKGQPVTSRDELNCLVAAVRLGTANIVMTANLRYKKPCLVFETNKQRAKDYWPHASVVDLLGSVQAPPLSVTSQEKLCLPQTKVDAACDEGLWPGFFPFRKQFFERCNIFWKALLESREDANSDLAPAIPIPILPYLKLEACPEAQPEGHPRQRSATAKFRIDDDHPLTEQHIPSHAFRCLLLQCR